jgi:hypothetical protein
MKYIGCNCENVWFYERPHYPMLSPRTLTEGLDLKMEIRKAKRRFSEKVWKRRIGLSTFGDVMKSKPSSAAATKSLNSVAGLELNDEIIPMLEVPLLALDGGECTGVESTLDLLGT